MTTIERLGHRVIGAIMPVLNEDALNFYRDKYSVADFVNSDSIKKLAKVEGKRLNKAAKEAIEHRERYKKWKRLRIKKGNTCWCRPNG